MGLRDTLWGPTFWQLGSHFGDPVGYGVPLHMGIYITLYVDHGQCQLSTCPLCKLLAYFLQFLELFLKKFRRSAPKTNTRRIFRLITPILIKIVKFSQKFNTFLTLRDVIFPTQCRTLHTDNRYSILDTSRIFRRFTPRIEDRYSWKKFSALRAEHRY